MALGGGTIRTTTFPGSYINFVSTNKAGIVNLGARGVVAMCVALPTATDTPVVECTASEFYTAKNPLGTRYDDPAMWMFSEVFKHATKVVVYNLKNEGASLTAGLTALESYDFNVIVSDSSETADATAIIAKVKSWRDELGKKVQAVLHTKSNVEAPNHIGVIMVASEPVLEAEDSVHPATSLVYWVAGAMAGCAVNKSCTNMLYDGEFTVNVAFTQSELQGYLDAGKIVFHLVYGEVRMLEDINSLVSPEADQNEDFKANQTIRVIDQIANDIVYLFNTKYLGRIHNNASGRMSLWSDIVSLHKNLETMGAIENFASENIVVQAGDTARSVVVQDNITITGTMSQLFMTVVID